MSLFHRRAYSALAPFAQSWTGALAHRRLRDGTRRGLAKRIHGDLMLALLLHPRRAPQLGFQPRKDFTRPSRPCALRSTAGRLIGRDSRTLTPTLHELQSQRFKFATSRCAKTRPCWSALPCPNAASGTLRDSPAEPSAVSTPRAASPLFASNLRPVRRRLTTDTPARATPGLVSRQPFGVHDAGQTPLAAAFFLSATDSPFPRFAVTPFAWIAKRRASPAFIFAVHLKVNHRSPIFPVNSGS